ncbi:hypothetical protein MCB86_03770, partial [Pseudomonas sp. KSR10]|uniref:hypothetical protein n=1 Tax=Pseudomonas sp. KSR10 TaxID=2916654 RepID=UPI001EF95F29
MIINLSPQLRAAPLSASLAGDVLILNGEAFDFSALPEGGTLPTDAIDSIWFERPGAVERIGGELHLTLILPVGPNPSQGVAFPKPVTVTEDGPILLPFDPEPEPEAMPDIVEELPA